MSDFFVTPQTVLQPVRLLCLWEFSRQEYWIGQPFPSSGTLSNLGIKHRSPALKANSLPSEAPGKPVKRVDLMLNLIIIKKTHLQSYLNPYHAHIQKENSQNFQDSIFFCSLLSSLLHYIGVLRIYSGGSDGKDSSCNAGDSMQCLIPGSGRSPGEGNGNPLQYS